MAGKVCSTGIIVPKPAILSFLAFFSFGFTSVTVSAFTGPLSSEVFSGAFSTVISTSTAPFLFPFEIIDSNNLTLEFTFNDNDDLTVDLPLLQGYEYDCNIEWGDGSTTEVKTADDKNKTHIYLNPGVYIVKIIGTCSTFNNYEYEIAYGKNAWNNLTAILSWR